MPTPANRQPSSNMSQGSAPIRRRGMRRQVRAFDLLLGEIPSVSGSVSRAAEHAPYRRVPSEVGSSGGLARAFSGALATPARPSTPIHRVPSEAGSSGGLARTSSGPPGAPARPSTPVPIMTPWRQAQVTVGGPEVDLGLLSAAEMTAGEAYLDRISTRSVNAGTRSDLGEDEAESAVRPSYSRAISAMRARLAVAGGAQGDIFDAWSHAHILEASDSNLPVVDVVADASADALAPVSTGAGVAAQQMLEREVANDQVNLGGEMVESDIRRAMAEQSFARLELCCDRAAARQLGGMRALRHYIQTSPDTALGAAAIRVMNCRIDPVDAVGFFRSQLIYRNVTGLCHDVGLRDLAELVWVAIQDAPVTSEKREELRALLLYNIADCAHGDAFCCRNGTFQRLLAPLDGVYPGVRTMSRTPYEVVQQVALTWREAIAAKVRANTPEDWSAFEQACVQKAEAYFAPDTALYPLIEQQLQRAIATCRSVLMQEI